MDTDEYLPYNEVVETEDEEDPDEEGADRHLPPQPTPDNPVDCHAPAIHPSPLHHSPQEEESNCCSFDTTIKPKGSQQFKRKTQSMPLEHKNKKKT